MVFDGPGELVYRAAQFEEERFVLDVPVPEARRSAGGRFRRPLERTAAAPAEIAARVWSEEAEIYAALVTGLRDYVDKNGFREVVIGLSGGIDSALTAAIAVDALGPDAVWGVTMPARYSSEGSVDDSGDLAANLGCRFDVIADRRHLRCVPRRARPCLRWDRAGRRRGEPPGPDPRGDPHGAVEQVRRHGAWPPATSRRWPSATPRSTATWWAGMRCSRTCSRRWCIAWRGGVTVTARSFRGRSSTSRRRRSSAPTRRTRTRCPSTTCSTRSCGATSSSTRLWTVIVADGFDAASWSSRSPGWSIATSTSGAKRPGGPDHPQGVRQGPPAPHHQSLRLNCRHCVALVFWGDGNSSWRRPHQRNTVCPRRGPIVGLRRWSSARVRVL